MVMLSSNHLFSFPFNIYRVTLNKWHGIFKFQWSGCSTAPVEVEVVRITVYLFHLSLSYIIIILFSFLSLTLGFQEFYLLI